MTLIIPITSLTPGVPVGSTLIPGVDVNDTHMAPSGTTKKYTLADIATYVLTLGGYLYLAPCRVATTANLAATYNNGTLGLNATLTNSGAIAHLSIDGIPLNQGDRVLVKNQGFSSQNGVYVVTNVGDTTLWVLTRAADWSVSAEMFDNQIVQIGVGIVNNNTVWISQITAPVVVGTDPINFGTFGFPTFPVIVGEGGTGLTTLAPYALMAGGTTATGNMQQISGLGTAGYVLTSNGLGGLPTWQAIPGVTGFALTEGNDTNVTLTLGGSFNTALLNAASITAGWTGTLAVGRGGTGVSSVTVAPAATAWAGWDANKNFSANNFLPGYATTATAGGTTTLTVGSAYTQYFTGVTTQTVLMPVVSTLVLGQPYYFFNNSSGNVTVQSSGGNNIQVMAPGTSLYMTCIAVTGTTAASWNAEYAFNGGSGSGTVSPGSINQVAWYAANGTVVSGLPTINNAVMITSAGGVPSFSTTLPAGLTIPGYGGSNYPFICNYRLSAVNGLPVTISDQLAVTTIYTVPTNGDQVALYDGVSAWTTLTATGLAISVPATTNTMYDVFLYNNSGTATAEILAWTNDTTRATNLTYQDGVLVKTGATTRRYIGSFRTTGVSGQTEDSAAKRYIWSFYNRACRKMSVVEPTVSWTYSTNAYRQSNANTANQLDMVIGWNQDIVHAQSTNQATNNTGSFRTIVAGIGLDSTTVNSAAVFMASNVTTSPIVAPIFAIYDDYVGVGRHTLVWLEKGAGADTQQFYGANSDQNGISGYLFG